MLTMILAIIALSALSCVLFLWGEKHYNGLAIVACAFGIIGNLAALLALLCWLIVGWDWMAAGTKAEILNREYNTTYTREEIFFASDVIEQIRELDRKRIEVNGDLFRDTPDKTEE